MCDNITLCEKCRSLSSFDSYFNQYVCTQCRHHQHGEFPSKNSFVDSIKKIPFMQNNLDFDLGGCKVFDTRRDAVQFTQHIVKNSAWIAAGDALKKIARKHTMDEIYYAVYDVAGIVARDATKEFTYNAVWDVGRDFALYCGLLYLRASAPIPEKHIDHINKRYAIWQNGYGVYCDIDGVFYVYRTLQHTPSYLPSPLHDQKGTPDMCDFFSFLADEKHNFYHFSHAQRLSKDTFKNGKTPLYDSHTSIAEYYGINEDSCNKYEYNPFTDQLKLAQQNMEENEVEALAFVHSIHWQDFFNNLEEIKTFFADLKDIPFMQNNLDFDLSGCEVFDTFEQANNSAGKAVSDATNNSAWFAARGAAFNAAEEVVGYDTSLATRTAIRESVGVPIEDIVLYFVIHYLCADLPIAQKHINYINKLYAIWQNGYGVYGDIDGVLYVYRRL